MESNAYIETRNGGYYVAGSRVLLDVLIHGFRNGQSPEDLFAAYPSLGSLAKVYGAITYVLEHPEEIEAYLRSQHELAEELRAEFPIPSQLAERIERAKADLVRQIA